MIGGAVLGSANVVDQGNQALRVNIVAGASAGGTSSNFGSSFPSAGTAVGAQTPTAAMGPLNVDGSGNLLVNVAVGGGGASGSTTVYQGTLPWVVTGSGGQVTVVGSGGLIGVNLSQVNSNTHLSNAGISGSTTLRTVHATANVVNITQVTVTGSVGGNQLIAANANRIKVRVTNTGTTACWVYYNSSVNTSTGDYLAGIAGYPWMSRYEGALYGYTPGATQLVTVYEESSQ